MASNSDELSSMESLVLLLRRVGERVDDGVRDALVPLEIGTREYGILALLAEQGPLSQQNASALLGIDRTSMVGLIDRLEAAELVVRERNADDRRAYLLQLTAAGEKRRRQAARALQQNEAKLVGRLQERDFRRLLKLLETLAGDAESEAAGGRS